jgi:hypothetical protein
MLRRSFVSALVGLALLAACGGDSATAPDPRPTTTSIAGTYNLQTVNGAPPPVIIFQSGADRVEVMSGNFTVNANSTFSNTHTFRATSGGQTVTLTETCTGTYALTGNSLSFSEATSGELCGGTFTGTVSGNTLTVAYDATLQAVYRR